jgi:hypothetical protein
VVNAAQHRTYRVASYTYVLACGCEDSFVEQASPPHGGYHWVLRGGKEGGEREGKGERRKEGREGRRGEGGEEE